MNKAKRKRLEEKGWKFTTAAEFLALTPEEEKYIEFKLSLARAIKERRKARQLTQEQCAKLLGSSQSRVAKMEAADPSVSVDLLFRALQKLRATGTAPEKKARRRPVAAAGRGRR